MIAATATLRYMAATTAAVTPAHDSCNCSQQLHAQKRHMTEDRRRILNRHCLHRLTADISFCPALAAQGAKPEPTAHNGNFLYSTNTVPAHALNIWHSSELVSSRTHLFLHRPPGTVQPAILCTLTLISITLKYHTFKSDPLPHKWRYHVEQRGARIRVQFQH